MPPHSRVSVIIATRNRADQLGGAIESALRAASDPEIVVVDDASTDATPAVAQSFERVRYIKLSLQGGVSAARNAGILASSGEFVTFLDDDDRRIPGSLDRECTLLDAQKESALAYGTAILVNQGGEQIGRSPEIFPSGDIFWELVSYNFIPAGSVVLRRHVFAPVGLFDPLLPTAEDWDLWLRMAEVYPVVAVEEPMVVVRTPETGSGQASLLTPETVARSLNIQARTLFRAKRRPDFSNRAAAARRRLRTRYAAGLLGVGADSWGRGEWGAGSRALIYAARLDPASVLRPYTVRRCLAALLLRARFSQS